MAPASAVVVMGVSGSGKSTIAAALASRIGGLYIDADDLHSDEARAQMAAGTPLTDADRTPWLLKVAERIDAGHADGLRVVMACSALRRSYRDALREDAETPLFFVHLHADPEVLAARLGTRTAHFMPATLLSSQLETLEPLGADEAGVVVDVAGDPDAIVDTVAAALPA